MKRALLAIAMFVIAGAAQPAMAQQNDTQQAPEEPEDDSDAEEEEENETEEEEREEAENETEENEQGESAQFDARLGTAINTLDSLVEIAPNEEARNGLQNALDNLREVQNNTDTASSSAPGEQPEGPERPDEAENESEEAEDEESESQGPPENRGPSQNSNRPGFVNEMLGGLFG
jgi:hypothetical protein